MLARINVLICYTHEDEEWKDRLVRHLRGLHNLGEIAQWDDQQTEDARETDHALAAANIAILMISDDFFASGYIRDKEIPAVMKQWESKELCVVPVILRPCAWELDPWLKRLQFRPKDGRSLSSADDDQIESDLVDIVTEISDLVRYEKIFLAKMPPTDSGIFGREAELAMLDKAWEDPKINVISLVASGGMGKTALVNKWLLRMGADNYRGAGQIYGWSFHNQTSADPFIVAALEWFHDPRPTSGSPWDKGERLAKLIRNHRTLLILDGVESLQYATGTMEGHLGDPGLQCLLQELSHYNPGLCVITTRLKMGDLLAKQYELKPLSPKAGGEVLSRLGVKGTQDEIEKVSEHFRGHALALTLLGTLLRDACGGDIRRCKEIIPLEDGMHLLDRARNVMESYESYLGESPELGILRMMGLFDHPAEKGALAVLRQAPVIPGLTDSLFTSEDTALNDAAWEQVVTRLRHARLLLERDTSQPETLDAHPLVREYFGEELRQNNPDAFQEAHSRLYEYYRDLPEEYQPDTLDEMLLLYEAVAHGCQAGRHQESLDEVYWRRIRRGQEAFIVKKLGAIGTDLAALSGFFDLPWRKPVSDITETDKAFVLNGVGFHLWALGRLAEAAEPMQAALEVAIEQQDWKNALRYAGNLSGLHLTMGEVSKALDYARQGVDYADRSGDAHWRMVSRTTLADALHQAGALEEARVLFCRAEEMQEERRPEYPLLYSLRGFLYCDLLLQHGKYQEVLKRAGQTLEWAKRYLGLLPIALDHLSLGRAHLLQARERTGDFSEAAEELEQAVDGLREAGQQDDLLRGLLARAELHRLMGNIENAQQDLDEAMTIATRGGMRLHQADCHLESARLYLSMDQKDRARESLGTARAMIEEMGYRRRDSEILEFLLQSKEESLEPEIEFGGHNGFFVGRHDILRLRLVNSTGRPIHGIIIELDDSPKYTIIAASKKKQSLRRLRSGEVKLLDYQIVVSATGTATLLLKVNGKFYQPALEIHSVQENPYFYGPAIEDKNENSFFGREAERKKILSNISMGLHSMVIGEQRSGKTSLLYHIKRNLPNQYIPVYISFSGTERDDDKAALTWLLDQIADGLMEKEVLSGVRHSFSLKYATDFAKFLKILVQEVKTVNRSYDIVLLLDEAHLMNRINVKFQEVLRETFHRLVQDVRVVVACYYEFFERVEATGSPFQNIFEYIHLTPLEGHDLQELIEEPARRFDFVYTEEAREEIEAMSGGHPYYCQYVCGESFTEAANNNVRTISIDHVRSAEKRVIDNDKQKFKMGYWDRMTREERASLKRLIMEGTADGISINVTNRLKKKFILKQSNEARLFTATLFEDWIRQLVEEE